MDQRIDLSSFDVRTDLALEAHEMARTTYGYGRDSTDESDGAARRDGEIPGVTSEAYEEDGIHVSWITIDNERGGQALGKLPGKYLTLEVPGLRNKDSELQHRVALKFADEFEQFLAQAGIDVNAKVLVIGLGNRRVTADALGPSVINNILVTRHLFELMPERVEDGYRPVSALAPGVLGTTGIETSEIVFGLVERTKPDVVVALDSLASRALRRVNTTIQVADTGINPGSGIGNKRKALTRETLGVPVLAIGVPTVVDAATIAHDTIDYVLANVNREMTQTKPANPLDPYNRPTVAQLEAQEVPPETRSKMMGMVGTLSPDEKRQLISEVLRPLGQNLIVTPKEVDAFIEDISNVLATGLNCALHQAVKAENVAAYTH
ncbi:GPR endopeptidase [Numidum massiliense]|uniref:GPR endopeptidase n=1 Tax=Numidum massiliense TaxID=1522315 RepID=UPI0006D53D67|nr:GPR endopeptidase [Numidum massiliense]